MNLEKLKNEVQLAAEDRATNELDRMIKLHEDLAKNYKLGAKLALNNYANTATANPTYSTADTNTNEWAKHDTIANNLKKLKEELA